MKNARNAFIWFGLQLILNSLWSVLFFGWNNPKRCRSGNSISLANDLTDAYDIFKKSKAAGLLLVPYFLWVSFAMALNITIWKMNG